MPTASTADLLQRQLADPSERQRLITAYVRDTMSPELLDAFETRLLDTPDLAAEVEAEDYLRETCRTLEERDVIAPPLAAAPRRERRLGFALAAGLLAGALLPSLMWWRAEQRLVADARPAGEAIAVFALSAMRGAVAESPPQSVPLPQTPRLALQVPAPNERGPYRVRVLGDAGAPLVEAVVADEADGYVGVSLDTAALGNARSAQLVIDVRRNGDWVAGTRYPLNFVAGAQRR